MTTDSRIPPLIVAPLIARARSGAADTAEPSIPANAEAGRITENHFTTCRRAYRESEDAIEAPTDDMTGLHQRHAGHHKGGEFAVTNDRDDLLHVAWAIIANTGGGDWSHQTEEWRSAATRWRNLFHARHKS